MTDTNFCLCVPVRNEAERLPILLGAIAQQSVKGRIPVALCINNSDDNSAAIAATLAERHAGRLDIRIDDRVFAPGLAHAGSARRHAMAMGLAYVGEHGVLISTDADCRPPADWIESNLAAIASGADVVGGRIVLDDREPIASAITAMQTRFDRYWAMVRAIEDAIDPSPHDPPPRHGDHTGASLAIDAGMYRHAGGVPAIRTGEDRALVIAALAAGARLVHPLAVWTRVSARIDGRADGGMAAAMRERSAAIGDVDEQRVPGFDHWRRRATWRRSARLRDGVAVMLQTEETLPPMPADMPLPAVTG